MTVKLPRTTHLGISEARAKLTSLVNEVYRGETRIVVEKSGIPVAVVVSPADLARLEQLDRRREAAWATVDEISTRFAGISEEELMERAVESVASVRAARRAARLTTETSSPDSTETEDAMVVVSRS